MGAFADLLIGTIADLDTRLEGLSWGQQLALLALCALLIFGLSRFLARPNAVSARAIRFAANLARAIAIFVAVYVVATSTFWVALPLALAVGSLVLAIAVLAKTAKHLLSTSKLGHSLHRLRIRYF